MKEPLAFRDLKDIFALLEMIDQPFREVFFSQSRLTPHLPIYRSLPYPLSHKLPVSLSRFLSILTKLPQYPCPLKHGRGYFPPRRGQLLRGA